MKEGWGWECGPEYLEFGDLTFSVGTYKIEAGDFLGLYIQKSSFDPH